MTAQIRKTLLHVETTLIEGGKAAPTPLKGTSKNPLHLSQSSPSMIFGVFDESESFCIV